MGDATAHVRDVPLRKGDVFEVLRNQRRRYALHYLKQVDEPVALGELAQQVAAWEYETTPEEVTPEQRKRVYTTLQQTHLPKMDRVGILSFDADEGIIEPTEQTAEVTIYLEIVPGREVAWREVYLAIGAVGCALAAAVWLQIYPFTLLPAVAWTAVLAVAVTVTAAVHVYHERHMRLGTGDSPPELSYGRDD